MKKSRVSLISIIVGLLFCAGAVASEEAKFKSPKLSPDKMYQLIIKYIELNHTDIDLKEYDGSLSYEFTHEMWRAFFICNDKAISRTGCHFSISATNSETPEFSYSGGK